MAAPSSLDAKQLMPDDKWHWLFTPEGLEVYQRQVGTRDDPPPALEVWHLDTDYKPACALMMLVMLDNALDSPEHKRALFLRLGREWANQNWIVYALRFASAAWGRYTTESRDQIRGRISQHPDRLEMQVVAGLTIDGRCTVAISTLKRGKKQRIKKVDPWVIFKAQNHDETDTYAYLLRDAFEGYFQAGLGGKQPSDSRAN